MLLTASSDAIEPLEPPRSSIGVLILGPFTSIEEDGIRPPTEMTPASSPLHAFAIARVAMPPWPKPKSMISRGLKPHFESRTSSMTSCVTSWVLLLKPASGSRSPELWSTSRSSPQWKPSGSGRGRGVGPCKVMQRVSGRFRARANDEKF